MSKTITVPDIGRFPIEITLNGVKYKLYPGATVTVSDGVADLLERLAGSKPKEPPVPETLTEGDVQAMVLAALETVQEMIDASTTPVTLDLSDEGSGITFDDEAMEYVGDESIDWSPLIDSVKAGKVWFYGEATGGSGGEHCAFWSYETNLTGERSFFFTGVTEDSFGVRLPIPSEEDDDEGDGGLAPLPVIPGGMVSLKLPTTNSGE